MWSWEHPGSLSCLYRERDRVTDFTSLNLLPPIQRALQQAGYQTPTPIQEQAIPILMDGQDLLGIAQTGTGKTAAFALPILDRLAREKRQAGPRAARVLVLTPTRELAAQIHASFIAYGRHLGLTSTVIFGGVGQHAQVQAMARGVAILVATPGRLLDLYAQKHLRLDRLEVFVLDEADRMLDMGFIHDVRKVIAALPPKRQTLLFSATMPETITELANGILHHPARVEVTPQATTVERVEQKVFFVEKANKIHLLKKILAQKTADRVLIFSRTKHGANRLVEQLERANIGTSAIHSNKSQGARERALAQFRSGEIRVLVATDIAARGIDVAGVSHVINFDLPNEPESYVHRIGRTARAGREGAAISFCDATERGYLRDIERTIRQTLPVEEEHPYHADAVAKASLGVSVPARLSRGGRPSTQNKGHRQDASRRNIADSPGDRTNSPQRTAHTGKKDGSIASKILTRATAEAQSERHREEEISPRNGQRPKKRLVESNPQENRQRPSWTKTGNNGTANPRQKERSAPVTGKRERQVVSRTVP
ncbi:MAG: DEAD/DEAH box helicase [Magnetococcales bacterium]|nr:DEAD/DEAH box helicase [Magnetococcales bacterium]MBF0321387.1 DEAD/DEAH box helicase [Magnetococcales bacterium]